MNPADRMLSYFTQGRFRIIRFSLCILAILCCEGFGQSAAVIANPVSKLPIPISRIPTLRSEVFWTKWAARAITFKELTRFSKTENIASLIEIGIRDLRVPFEKEISIASKASSLEEGDKILLRFLQSESKDFDIFSKGVKLVKGGDSVALGKAIGKPTGGDWAAHHIIPTELREHRALEKIGFDLDRASNGIALPNKANVAPTLPLHKGSHPGYTSAMNKALDEIPRNLSEEETRKAVEAIQGKFRARLATNVRETQLHENLGGIWQWPFID